MLWCCSQIRGIYWIKFYFAFNQRNSTEDSNRSEKEAKSRQSRLTRATKLKILMRRSLLELTHQNQQQSKDIHSIWSEDTFSTLP